jgi:uncharacterized phage protein gp47/JayE
MDASGGNDIERREDMRAHAPASVLTMERAVSVSDFEQLALQHRSITKARAFYSVGLGAGRTDQIDVVAVLAEGRVINKDTRNELAGYLQARAVPTVSVIVSEHLPKPVAVTINIRVDSSRCVPTKVQQDVIAAVGEAFQPNKRQLGEAVHISAIYGVVEAVQGVEDCTCNFDCDANALVIDVAPRELAFVAGVTCGEPTEYSP